MSSFRSLGASMLFFDGGFALIFVVLWLFCLFDVITTDAALCRNLPKIVWLLIVLLLPDVGSIIWLIAGHPWSSTQRRGGLPYKGNVGYGIAGGDGARRTPQIRGSNSYGAAGIVTNPDDDEDFMRQVRRRAEQQRRSSPGNSSPGNSSPRQDPPGKDDQAD